MTQFEYSAPGYGFGRSPVTAPRITPESPNLIAPGLAVTPPVSNDNSVELLASLGLVSDAVNVAARIQQNRIAREEEQRAIFEHDAAKSARIQDAERDAQRGLGAREARMSLPRLASDVEAGTIAPNPGETPEAFAARVIASETNGLDDDFADGFLATAGPSIAQALVNRAEKAKAREQSSLVQSFADSASVADTEDGVRSAIQSAVAIGIDETDAHEIVGLQAMQAAAARGDAPAFNRIASVLGDRFKTRQDQLRYQLDNRVRESQREVQSAGTDAVFAMLRQKREPESIRAAIHRMVKLGTLDEGRAATFNDMIDRDETMRQREALKLQAETDNAAVRQSIVEEWTRASLSADVTGGLNAMSSVLPSGKMTWTDAEGKEQSITDNDIKKAVVPIAMSSLTVPDNPDQTFANQLNYVALNGAVYQPWADTISGGYRGAASSFSRMDKDGTIPPLPTTVAAGYELAKRMKAGNYAAYAAHTSEPERRFYDFAEVLERHKYKGEPQKALLEATRAIKSPPVSIDAATRRNIERSLDFSTGSLGYMDAVGRASELTGALIAIGVSPSTAADEAATMVRRDFTDIDGVLVYTGGKTIPDDMSDLSRDIAKEYAAKFGNTEGIEAGDIVLVPGFADDTWVPAWRGGNSRQLVDEWDQFQFTSAQLMERSRNKAQSAAKAAENRIDNQTVVAQKVAQMQRQHPSAVVYTKAEAYARAMSYSGQSMTHPKTKAFVERQERDGKWIVVEDNALLVEPPR